MREQVEALRQFALGFPGAWEDSPWDERVIKVGKKVFVFFGLHDDWDKRLYVGVKLPNSEGFALSQPNTELMGYNLGQHHWVQARYFEGDEPPLDALMEWIEESYRAVATKKMIAALDAQKVAS